MLQIVGLLVELINRTIERRKIRIQMTDDAKRWIVEKTCKDRTYGARPLRRALQRYVEDPLSEALIQGQFGETDRVEVYLDGDQLQYRTLGVTEGDALLV
jgi:ATP-dependent Clp protease ATP-binding subunit ClpC